MVNRAGLCALDGGRFKQTVPPITGAHGTAFK